MSADCFLDTNILVYAVDGNPTHAGKRAIAQQLIAERSFGLSVQVLQEFYVTVTRKFAQPLSAEDALACVEQFLAFPVIPNETFLLTTGILNSLKYQVSYWDGAIIAAAESLHVETLFTEDLNHGQHYGTVQAVNPFL